MTTPRTCFFILSLVLIGSYTLPGNRHNDPIHIYHHDVPQKAQYTNAMLKGTGIGFLTGTWCALTDIATQGKLAPLTWLTEHCARKIALYPALDSYGVHEAPIYRDTINNAAWVSSWASYITALSLFSLYAGSKY